MSLMFKVQCLKFTIYCLPITVYRLRFTYYRLSITNQRLPISDHRLPITDYKLPFNRVFLFLLFVLFPFIINAQAGITSFGFVVKPVFPSKFFRTGAQVQEEPDSSGNAISFTLAQRSGFSAGALVRKGITKNLSAETGIKFVKRIYQLDIRDTASNISENADFKIIGYEIPLQILVFVQLSREIWMNASLGTSLDIFPSNVQTRGSYYIHKSIRKSNFAVFNTGVIANIGWEYRTEKSGIIYLGGSYHRSFNDTYRSVIGYYSNIRNAIPVAATGFNLKGDYLTLDLRYYFKGDVNKKKKNK